MRWLDALVEHAQAQLGDREREALWTRGVTDQQIELFRLGYLNKKLPDVDDGDSFREKYEGTHWLYDVFVLPLTNTLGQIKGVQLRHVEVERKGYSDFSPYEDEPVLFGLAQAMPHVWRTHAVWIVEGVFDLFPIQRVYPNIFSTLTNHISDQVARTLRRLVDVIWLAYDMDSKGREAAFKACKQHGQSFTMHNIKLPRVQTLDGKARVKDPAELWEAWGDQRLQTLLNTYNAEDGDG